MMAGMVFEHRKHLVAQFLIEAWCLEVVGVEDHVLTPTDLRFLLNVIRRSKDRDPWLSLLSVVPSPCCVYYAAIPCAQYPLPSLLAPRNDAEETFPWTSPRWTNCSRPPEQCENAWI
jgi:hypothetical protein